jgi:ketosteroid isomerase-like protein
MKNIILSILLFSSSFLYAQKNTTAIKELLSQQTMAWNNGDIVGFMKTYWKNDSLMFVGKSGITWGWENTLNGYKKSYPSKEAMGKLSFDIIKIKLLTKDDCFVVGKWMLQRTADSLNGHYTLLLRRIKGEWKIIIDHSS